MGTWCSETVIFFIFKGLCIVINNQNKVTWCSDTVIVYSGIFKILSIIITLQNLGPWCSDTKFFWEFQKIDHLNQNIFFINTSFDYGMDEDYF